MKFQVLRKAFAAGAAMFSAILIFCSFQFLQQTKNFNRIYRRQQSKGSGPSRYNLLALLRRRLLLRMHSFHQQRTEAVYYI
jgi:ABC-type Fe3+ transport system permease subunit